MEKIAVILGAGAAHDVANESRATETRLQPPLVNELFGLRAKKDFSTFLEEYPGANLLYNEMFPLAAAAAASSEKPFNLEAKLQEYASDEAPPTIARAFRYIPPYIRDVLAASSNAYARNVGTYTQLIMKLLVYHPHEVAFIVMNYDILLELGLEEFGKLDGRTFSFRTLPDYIEKGRDAHVYKLHGSTNWFVPLAEEGAGTWDQVVAAADLISLRDRPVNVVVGHSRMNASWDKKWWYPLMTMPLADKGEDAQVCPDSHVEQLREWLVDCHKFLIAGTSGQDADLMVQLRAVKSPPALLHYVSLNEAADVRARFEEAVPQFRFASPTTFDRGLRQYVNSEEFEQIARS